MNSWVELAAAWGKIGFNLISVTLTAQRRATHELCTVELNHKSQERFK